VYRNVDTDIPKGGARARERAVMLPHRCDMQSVDAHALGHPLDSNDSACTSLFPPIAPNEPRDESNRFLDELLLDLNPDDLLSFNPSPSEEARLCKSCKKQKPEAENFDPGRKTCRSCLRTHRNHMRHKRRKLKQGNAAPAAAEMARIRNALEADPTATARSDDSEHARKEKPGETEKSSQVRFSGSWVLTRVSELPTSKPRE